MKIRNRSILFTSTAAALFGLTHIVGCGGPSDEPNPNPEQTLAALNACHLNDGTVEHNAQLRACDPQDTKKTTVCHIPPGNPANAHTLCIGNAAVPAHMKHHGDHIGPCEIETPCPPPPGPQGTGGSDGNPTGGSGGGGPPSPEGTGGVSVPIL